MAKAYCTSPIKDLKPVISAKNTLCLADDLAIAQAYLRGGLGVEHYTYTAEWDSANLATEKDLGAIVEAMGITIEDDFDCQPYLAMKNAAVRAAVVKAGFDGVSYEDTHEGCNYETTELLCEPEGFRFTFHSTVKG